MSANGYLRPDELTIVQGTMRLSNDTARAWFRMKADAAKDGVTLTIAAPVGAYRTWPIQVDMRVHPNLYGITPGIVPGLPSQHGLGICVDIASGLAWVKANGSRYGFTFPLAFDHNHARYDGVAVPASESGAPITTPSKEEDEMAIRGITWTGSDGKAHAAQYSDSGFYSEVQGDQTLYNAMNAAGIPFFNTTESHAQAIAADCAKVRPRA